MSFPSIKQHKDADELLRALKSVQPIDRPLTWKLNRDDDPNINEVYPVSELWEAPFSKRMSLPAPSIMTPSTLKLRLLRELEFPEAPTMIGILEKCNADLFSCMPSNVNLYEDVQIFSQSPGDVLNAVDAIDFDTPRPYSTAVDLNAHGSEELPEVPNDVDGLTTYVESIQRFFISELIAREKEYLKLFVGYCAALVRYFKKEAIHFHRADGSGNGASALRIQIHRMITDRYYVEAARLARIIYLHLYLSVCREVTRRLAVTQNRKKEIFEKMKYEWAGNDQFSCLFHAVVQNHGVSLIGGYPLTSADLKQLNQIRVALGIYPIRCRLLEAPGEELTELYSFSAVKPKSGWYLNQKLLEKLSAYNNKRSQTNV